MGYAEQIAKAIARAKKPIEAMYRDVITVYVRKDKPTESGFDERSDLIELYTNIPAKVSKSGLTATEKAAQPTQSYDAVIYTTNDITVPSGAMIKLTDVNGNVITYRRAGHGYKSFKTHQEIPVVYDEVS